jgi:hypothetical protein
MPVKTAKVSAARAKIENVLFGIYSSNDDLRITQLDVEKSFSEELLALASNCLDALSGMSAIPYDPTFGALDQEYMSLSLASAKHVSDTVQTMEQGPHPSFALRARGTLSGLRFYAFKTHENGADRWFFGRLDRSIVLTGKKLQALIVEGGTKLVAVREDIVQLRRNIDFLSDGQTGLIFHVQNFHYIFNFYQRLRKIARKNAGNLAEKVPIKNLEEFIAACEAQPAMALKLHSIVTHEMWKDFPVMKAFKAIDETPLPIQTVTENGERKLVFVSDLKHRWLILRLLGDDILKSMLSERIFEATSKKALPT